MAEKRRAAAAAGSRPATPPCIGVKDGLEGAKKPSPQRISAPVVLTNAPQTVVATAPKRKAMTDITPSKNEKRHNRDPGSSVLLHDEHSSDDGEVA